MFGGLGQLIGHSFSVSAISGVVKKLDEELLRFARRRLAEPFTYLVLEPTCITSEAFRHGMPARVDSAPTRGFDRKSPALKEHAHA